MSEFIKSHANEGNIRSGFLAGASTLAFLSTIYASQSVASEQDALPTIWIELGGQLEQVSGMSTPFSPAFLATNADSPVFEPTSPIEAQRQSRFSIGEEGKISFRPHTSTWVFTAGVRYGRSNGKKDFEYQTEGLKGKNHFFLSQPVISFTQGAHNFSEVQSRQQENHLVLDFQAGRDVGLGFFGGTSNVDVGVRFAQFTSKAQVNLHARPDLEQYRDYLIPSNHQKYFDAVRFRNYAFAAHSERSFHGVGPSLSWNGSVPLVGGERDAHLDLDLGLSGAVLFGRQKANLEHQTTARYLKQSYSNVYKTLYHHSLARNRSHSVVVPNIGAFAGISYRIESFKMSAGYRADFFFGAMDTGIDAADRTATSFHGPFATISIGLGN